MVQDQRKESSEFPLLAPKEREFLSLMAVKVVVEHQGLAALEVADCRRSSLTESELSGSGDAED